MVAQRKSILLIDDDPTIRFAVQQLLQDEGYSVQIAEDGRQGLRAMIEKDFDMVLLDIFMPRMNGLDCIRALKIARPEVKVIIVTGSEESEMAKEAYKYGALELVSKPFTKKTLLATLERYLSCPTDREEND